MKRLSYIKKRSLIPGRADRELRVRVSNFGGVCAVPLAFKGTPFPQLNGYVRTKLSSR